MRRTGRLMDFCQGEGETWKSVRMNCRVFFLIFLLGFTRTTFVGPDRKCKTIPREIRQKHRIHLIVNIKKLIDAELCFSFGTHLSLCTDKNYKFPAVFGDAKYATDSSVCFFFFCPIPVR